MPDMSIRGISEEEYAALKQHAQAAGKSLETWARDLLLASANKPVVKERYAYRFYTKAGGGHGKITRRDNRPGGTGSVYTGLSREEADAVRRIEDIIRRNDPGDRERAVAMLMERFEDVVEVPV